MTTAQQFLDSVGVNTHFGYSGTPYVDRFDEVCVKLRELGIKHVRDGGPVLWNQKPAYMDAIWDRLRRQPCELLYVLDAAQTFSAAAGNPAYPYIKSYGATDIALIRSKLGDKVTAWEGLNEPDLKVGGVDWAAKTVQFQQAAARDRVTDTGEDWALDEPGRVAPLLVSAIGHPWEPAPYASLGFKLWDYGTHAAAHFYAGTEPPENARTLANLKLLRRYSADLPIWVTECGYQTSGPKAISEELQAKYLWQTLLWHPMIGVGRTYLYELIDQKPNAAGTHETFGLLRYDLSEKPAFTLLKSILQGLQ